MSDTQKKFYLTTPIYYVNARPHIGHAYTTIVADVIARRHRLLGDDTFFLTGTDEHGQKIERSAAAAGIPPQQFADQVSLEFRNLWDRMGLTYDDYIRTTDEAHKRGVQKLFQLLRDRGAIYLSTYTGQYSVGEEMFVEGPPGTIGPDGKPTETVTEENYFFKLSEFQLPLIDLIESGQLAIQPEARKNEVLSFLRGNVAAVVTEVYDREVRAGREKLEPVKIAEKEGRINKSAASQNYVPGALKDLSISRSSFKWGIPVPGDEKHVIYVWLDALANYMTAIGYGSEDSAEQTKFERYWPADLHLVGKEIIRFHCVYWPAFLLAANLPLPKAITAHGWLLFEDSKMSKSRGNIVRTETILDAFGEHVYKKQFHDSTKSEQDLFAADVLRYFLLREIPFGQDGSFSFDALVQRYNSDLANGYGNLVSRTLSMIDKYTVDGRVPLQNQNVDQTSTNSLGLPVSGNTRIFLATEAIIKFGEAVSDLNFAMALERLWFFVRSVDNYLSAEAPWKLGSRDEDLEKRANILYTAAESIRIITALLYPILPYATAKVWAQLGLGDIQLASDNGELRTLTWGGLKPGTKLGPLSPIFPRADKGLIQIMTDMETPKPEPSKLIGEKTTASAIANDPTHPGAGPRTSALNEPNPGAQVGGAAAPGPDLVKTPPHTEALASGPFAASAAASTTPDTPQISIDDFVKVDLRVAQIIVAERIPKADKLLRLEVDLGYEKRQILAGIAEYYAPETLIGRKVIIVANLAPRKMRGLESQGMIVAASLGEAGQPVLAGFLEDVEIGARLK